MRSHRPEWTPDGVAQNSGDETLKFCMDVSADRGRVAKNGPVPRPSFLLRIRLRVETSFLGTGLMRGVVSGKSVLLTGAGGSLGSALAKAIVLLQPRHLILLVHSERNLHQIDLELTATPACVSHSSVLGDVCDASLLSELFQRYRPEIVYHAAAFKHVPLMERNPLAAIRNNASGTNTLAKVSRAEGLAKLVMISTDKAVNPISIMGASKRVAELALSRWSTPENQMRAIRLGNILGSDGSVVPTFLRQIARGGPVTVTHREVSRYFLTMEEASELVLLTSVIEDEGTIYIPRIGAPVKILDLARQLVANSQAKSLNEISIELTGLRPGDKMSEEFLFVDESAEPTPDPRIFRVNTPAVPSKRYDAGIERLDRGVEQRNLPLMMEALCQLVPEYRPTESLNGVRHGSAVALE